ncbi:MAG: phosphopyruvate hydratase [Defluviicoccus sp.]|nr:phosphopyruvate hydratase [Defluviicoccus sp.]MDE0276112.1 phosphopyruvate hydratase [Defluviicoccus sp.]
MSATTILSVHGRRVWDSRARPTVEVEVALAGGARGRAIAPAGASRGSGEAADLRDGGDAFGGYGVDRAVAAVNGEIAAALAGLDARDREGADRRLIGLDGTADKSRLGGNALVAASMAVAHAAAAAEGVPLWRHLAGDAEPVMPLPEIQIFGGGAHAARRVDIQDFMVVAVGASDYGEALDWTAEVYRAAGAIMAERGLLAGTADEGGFWPAFDGNGQALETLVEAIERAGLTPGGQVAISLDVAASEFGARDRYRLARDGKTLDTEGMCELLGGWIERFPIVSVEDPLAEDDLDGLAAFTRAYGARVQIVGDDALVSDAARVNRAAAAGACNAVLLKPNQAGTLTECGDALEAARAAGYGAIVSARSGETEDVTVVHLAVGWGAGQIKVGSIAHGERTAKWNEGLRIAETLPHGGRLPPRSAFPWGA